MKRILIVACLFLLLTNVIYANKIYSRTFGKSNDIPVIFLHGGPSNSSVYFEATTAQKLADQGFYVIIYDRRGEGRSADKDAKMNFREAVQDLTAIYRMYNLTKANLISFSFGGLVTAQFAQKFPEKVNSITLVSALTNQQEHYDTILRNVTAIYKSNHDNIRIKQVSDIEKMDKNSLDYRTACFKHASENGFFKLKNPNNLAKQIYSTYDSEPLITNYVKNEAAVPTFWKNEKLKNINIQPILINLKKSGIKIFALYGKQDGLYSQKTMDELEAITGKGHIKYLDNCSHTLFIDQQAQFISSCKNWIN